MFRYLILAFIVFASSTLANAEALRLYTPLHQSDEPFALQALAPLPSLPTPSSDVLVENKQGNSTPATESRRPQEPFRLKKKWFSKGDGYR